MTHGHKNAVPRFVVLTQPRSGSHMLRTILSRHPQARCLGELFNRTFAVAQLWPDHPAIDDDLPAYVRGLIARAFASANGFLLHASQGLSPSWERQIYPALRNT